MQAKIIQEKYDNVADLRIKMDDLKMELREESTKASKYFQSADGLKMQLANEKHKAAQCENKQILLNFDMDPNLQAAATSIGGSVRQPSFVATTFASLINVVSTANNTHAPTFVSSTNGLPMSICATQTGQHVSSKASLTTAGSRAISVLSSDMPTSNVTSITNTSSTSTASTITTSTNTTTSTTSTIFGVKLQKFKPPLDMKTFVN